MSKQFKAGDNIRCVNARGWGGLTVGNVYEAIGMNGPSCVTMVDDSGKYSAPYAARFELVTPPVRSAVFKTGERVTVARKVASRNGRSFPWLDTMDATLGRVGECTGKSHNFDAGTAYAVKFPDGNECYFLPESLEVAPQPAAFKVGDTVRLKDQSKFGGGWGGPMDVRKVNNFGTVFAYNETAYGGMEGGFNPDDLEHVPQTTAYKVSANAPRGPVLWPKPYASIEEAREAIIKGGRRGVSYEIFPYTVAETVRLVETTTRSLEAA